MISGGAKKGSALPGYHCRTTTESRLPVTRQSSRNIPVSRSKAKGLIFLSEILGRKQGVSQKKKNRCTFFPKAVECSGGKELPEKIIFPCVQEEMARGIY